MAKALEENEERLGSVRKGKDGVEGLVEGVDKCCVGGGA